MIWVYRAWYHNMVEELPAAEEAILEALRLHPISPLAHHEYANLLRKQGRPEVERHQKLAGEGRELRTQLIQLPTAADLSSMHLQRIQEYASDCGDELVARALAKRLGPEPLSSLSASNPLP